MPEIRRAVTPVLTAIVLGVVLAGLMMAGLGIWLVYMVRHGHETLSIFGQQLDTMATGSVAIFIGGVAIGAGAIIRVMGSKPT